MGKILDDMTWHVVSRQGGLQKRVCCTLFCPGLLLIRKRVLILILNGIGMVPDGSARHGTAYRFAEMHGLYLCIVMPPVLRKRLQKTVGVCGCGCVWEEVLDPSGSSQVCLKHCPYIHTYPLPIMHGQRKRSKSGSGAAD